MNSVRHIAIVPTDLDSGRQVSANICRRHSGLNLVPASPRRGTLADGSQRFPITATTGRQATYGYLELTPLDTSYTQVELALSALIPKHGRWRLPGAARRAVHRVERDVNAFAQALGPAGPAPRHGGNRPLRRRPAPADGRASGTATALTETAAMIASSLLRTPGRAARTIWPPNLQPPTRATNMTDRPSVSQSVSWR